MRRVYINGTPPQDWVTDAEAVTQQLRDASKVSLTANDYTIQLFPALKTESEMPSTGIALLAIGELNKRLCIRVFDGTGIAMADIRESKQEPDDSPIHEMQRLLTSNWDANLLKPLEKIEICKIATSIVQRAKIGAIIESKEDLWRDDRIRNWLLSQFNNKCWYSEAQDSVSSVHVDHYRPKGRLKQELGGETEEGYWWLAFDWRNYRICGQLLNVKKGDLFPIIEGKRCMPDSPESIQLEAPILIDPLGDQTRLISYEKDEDACIAVIAGGIGQLDQTQAIKTIDILGLNRRPRLNEKRNEFWDRCMMRITEYRQAQGPQALRLVRQASAKSALKQMVAYNAEFSSVSEACIRKNAPESLIAAIFEV